MGLGMEPNHSTARKCDPLYIIQYSLFSTNYQVVSSADMKACLFVVDFKESMGFRKLSRHRELNQHFFVLYKKRVPKLDSNILCINV